MTGKQITPHTVLLCLSYFMQLINAPDNHRLP